MDLAGNGELELVDFSGPAPGFHARDQDEGWRRHVPFAHLPQLDWQDPNLRFIDLTGDGRADVLISEHEVFTCYPSEGERGFGTAIRQHLPVDEDAGPRLVFNDGTQSIFLADMCGDGLTDIVRIRNGEVCYWPNLGYGRFGRKVTMANAPRFDSPEHFDPRRIRLADIDGSGPIDILYLGRLGAQLYFNRSGNQLSHARTVPMPLATENLDAVQVADLLGNGTACLVWNSHLPAEAPFPVRYIDLMGGSKPHLLTAVDNHLGAQTHIEYTPSTAFYLRDKAAGEPWVTRLPFPVHCVSKVTVHDRWRRTTFSTCYSYHHGHFDGEERVTSFGRVEQWDTQAFLDVQLANTGSAHVTQDRTLYQAPVKTVTWFHTGVADQRRRLLAAFAHEYFTARHATLLQQAGFAEPVLPEPELELGGGPPLATDEWREALHACRGMLLRQEVYELDPSALEQQGRHVPVRLFTAAQHRCLIRRVQPKGSQRHAVFLALESEAVTCHYELDLGAPAERLPELVDPRVAHTLNLRFDDYGRAQQVVSVVYPRHRPHVDERQSTQTVDLIRSVQAERHIAYAETRFTLELDAAQTLLHHRLPMPCEVLTYELTGSATTTGFAPSRGRYFAPGDFLRFRLSDSLQGQGTGTVTALPYHEHTNSTSAHKRLVEHAVTQYWNDASATNPPSDPLPIGSHGPRGLKYQDYKLALTDGLLATVFGAEGAGPSAPPANKLQWEAEPNRTCRQLLDDPAVSGYIRGGAIGRPDTEYWMRSGIAGFASDAPRRFYLPESFTDAFDQRTTVAYDPLVWYVASSTDPKGNRTEVQAFDFRVLAPVRLRDASQNVSVVAFDILGMPVVAATLGKVTPPATADAREITESGDCIDEFGFEQLNPSSAEIAEFFDPPAGTASIQDRARNWLGKATARFVYHFGETRDAQGRVLAWGTSPAAACGITRELHERDAPNTPHPLPSAEGIAIQMAVEYSDGAGQVFVKNVQAEPETPGGPLRWLTNGLTVLNNKGKPVLQYEPYFSARGHHYAPPEAHGVSAVMHYDAAGRPVRSDMPDGTVTRVVFSPWHSEAWDAGDTVFESTWYATRQSIAPATRLRVRANGLVGAVPEQRAGWLSARYANTPTRVHFDSLGREVVSIAHNRVQDRNGTHRYDGSNWGDEFHVTFTKLDAEGKPLWIRDARGNLVMQYVTPHKPTRWADEANELPYTTATTGPAGPPMRVACRPCYDIAGNLLHQHSMDAGDRWMLHDAAGQPLLAWDANDRRADDGSTQEEHLLYRTEYDALRRPTAQWLRVWQRPKPQGGNPPQAFQAQSPVLLERLAYQDGLADDPHNLNGQPVQHFDASGLVQTVRRSFAGHVEEVQRRLVADSRASLVDWTAPLAANDSRLEADIYLQITEHDALGRMRRHYNWHRSGTPVAVYEPRYNARGLLQSETLRLRTTRSETGYEPNTGQVADAIAELRYDARGQKIWLALGNGTLTRYEYDDRSFRLTRLYTRRGATYAGDCISPTKPPANVAAPDAPPPSGRRCGVQNLSYTYDAAGNITHIRDDAQQTIYFSGVAAEPSNDYTYDALYRLTAATGREQAGNTAAHRAPEAPWPRGPIPSSTTLRRYTQRYEYDAVGNFVVFRHIAHGEGATNDTWQRHYRTAVDSNRLLQTRMGDGDWAALDTAPDTHYRHDPHGSMLNIGATPAHFDLDWDHRDMIRHIDLQGGGQAWYQYDSGKQRTRKFISRQGDHETEERLYLGGFERYRRKRNHAVVEEIESHHLFEGEQRVLLVDDVISTDRTHLDGTPFRTQPILRYQYGNHLGSVSLELDEVAQIVSCEESHPWGTISIQLLKSDIEVPAKRYRYTGMERDEESGLSLHGARYLLPMLGHWLSVDPLGDQLNRQPYEYASSNPLRLLDRSGERAATPDELDLIETLTRLANTESARWDNSSAPVKLAARLLPGTSSLEKSSIARSHISAIRAAIERASDGEAVERPDLQGAWANNTLFFDDEGHFAAGLPADARYRTASESRREQDLAVLGALGQSPLSAAGYLVADAFGVDDSGRRSVALAGGPLWDMAGAGWSAYTHRQSNAALGSTQPRSTAASVVEPTADKPRKTYSGPSVSSHDSPEKPYVGIPVPGGNGLRLFGPFYRAGSPEHDVTLMRESGEWWGGGNTTLGKTDHPEVLAYTKLASPVTVGGKFAQFYTTAPVRRGSGPGIPSWTPNGQDVREEDGWAKIDVYFPRVVNLSSK